MSLLMLAVVALFPIALLALLLLASNLEGRLIGPGVGRRTAKHEDQPR